MKNRWWIALALIASLSISLAAQTPESDASPSLRLEPVTNAVTPAEDISAGSFGGNTGGGNYFFPGRVGFGTTSPAGTLHTYNGALYMETISDATSAWGIAFRKARGTSPATRAVVQSGDSAGFFSFNAWDGTIHRGTAMIRAEVDGTPGATSIPGRITFHTSTATSENFFERMRLTADGNLGIGTTSPQKRLDVVGDVKVTGQSFFNLSTPISSGDSLNVGTGMGAQRFSVSAGDAANLTFTRARGSESSPVATFNGDETGRLLFRAYDGAAPVTSARLGAVVDGSVSTGVVPQALTFKTGTGNTPDERMRITSGGNVGIGTATPAAKFHVVGNAHFDGTVTGTYIKAHYQDVAEWVPSNEDLAPGTVVVLDAAIGDGVMASNRSYDTSVAGVVSAQPGIILGQEGSSKEQVATTGRVRVKVDASRGAIAVGDLLVTSDRRGYAMRSTPIEVGGTLIHRPGTIIGKALQPLNEGEGEILVLLSMQ